jgi:hypothetical protein
VAAGFKGASFSAIMPERWEHKETGQGKSKKKNDLKTDAATVILDSVD